MATLKEEMIQEYGNYGAGAPDALWVAHPHLPGKQILHTKAMFGKSNIRAYGDITTAKRVAHDSNGTIASHASGLWHVLRDTPKHVKEEYGAGEDGSTEASTKYKNDTPGQENAHIPLRKQVLHTIKRVIHGKYTKGRSLIN